MEKMPRWEKLILLNDSEIEIHYNGDIYKGALSHLGRFIEIFFKNSSRQNHYNLCDELFDDWRSKHFHAFESFKNPPTKGHWPETTDPIGFAIEYMKTYGTGIIYDGRTQVVPTLVGDTETYTIKIDEIKKKEDTSLNTNIFKQQVKPNYKFTL